MALACKCGCDHLDARPQVTTRRDQRSRGRGVGGFGDRHAGRQPHPYFNRTRGTDNHRLHHLRVKVHDVLIVDLEDERAHRHAQHIRERSSRYPAHERPTRVRDQCYSERACGEDELHFEAPGRFHLLRMRLADVDGDRPVLCFDEYLHCLGRKAYHLLTIHREDQAAHGNALLLGE